MALDTGQNRSTANSVINTTVGYEDLSMTQYPKVIDSRNNNLNMQGFINVGDATAATPLEKMYNMAEHVNALADAVMAVQRVLGINPHHDSTTAQPAPTGTVSGRISQLESPTKYDSRYGGTGWLTSQNLVGHKHLGVAGGPSKINMGTEVQGILKKINIDLAAATGITGADLAMSASVSTKIDAAIDDKLSTSQGGSVKADLNVLGNMGTRTLREWNHTNAKNGTKITTSNTSTNNAYRGSGTADVRFIHEGLVNFEYGKYVIGVRLRVSSLVSENVAYIRLYNKLGGVWAQNKAVYLTGQDFNAVNQFQMFYMVCDIEGDNADSYPIVHIGKDATAVSVNVDFDNAFIMPVHPAVFDR